MKNNFSLLKDHYLRVLIEFTIIGLLIMSIYNGLNMYLYFKDRRIIPIFLYLNSIPFSSFIIFLLRYFTICFKQHNAISGIGEIIKLYEKGKGWYEFNFNTINDLVQIHNSLVDFREIKNVNKINRFCNIQGIEYVYNFNNEKILTRRQYIRNVSIDYIHKKIFDTNKLNIKINNRNPKQAYIV